MTYHGRVCSRARCRFHWWWQWGTRPGREPKAYLVGVTLLGHGWTWDRRALARSREESSQ